MGSHVRSSHRVDSHVRSSRRVRKSLHYALNGVAGTRIEAREDAPCSTRVRIRPDAPMRGGEFHGTPVHDGASMSPDLKRMADTQLAPKQELKGLTW